MLPLYTVDLNALVASMELYCMWGSHVRVLGRFASVHICISNKNTYFGGLNWLLAHIATAVHRHWVHLVNVLSSIFIL